MNTTFFAIIGTSRNAYGGPSWTLDAMVSEADIIRYAQGELEAGGESLESRAGIDANYDEDGMFLGYGREFDPGEELETALTVLNSDGHPYMVWMDDVADNVDDFIDQAVKIGHGDEAARMVRKFSPPEVVERVFSTFSPISL